MRRYQPWFKGAAVAGMFMLGVAAVGVAMPVLSFALGRRSGGLIEAIALNWNRAVCRILNLYTQVSCEIDAGARLSAQLPARPAWPG